ncbi:hypothetical protein [Nonomuraea longicatena]|uniref:Septum formation-related domain-containing protein n=1 Tax=Nonomuraea longicatena TaxID=83682 RepID=A0ABN1NVQ4_9ACTN
MIGNPRPAVSGGPGGLPKLLGGLMLAGLLATGCTTSTAAVEQTPTPDGSRMVKFLDIPNGSCINTEQIPGRDGMVPLVDCKGPHMYKTYAATDLPSNIRDGPFPGYETVSRFAGEFCDKEYLKIHNGPSGKGGRPPQFIMAPFESVQWRPEQMRVICAEDLVSSG